MSRYQIEREYAREGRPFRHDPKAEVTAATVLQSPLMKRLRNGGEHEAD